MDIGTASAHQPLMGGPTVSNPATANLSHFRGVLDRRLHTANTTRSLAPSPSPALQEPSPFKQGSPLAPIQDGREQHKAAQIEIASHRPALKTGSAKMMMHFGTMPLVLIHRGHRPRQGNDRDRKEVNLPGYHRGHDRLMIAKISMMQAFLDLIPYLKNHGHTSTYHMGHQWNRLRNRLCRKRLGNP
jgi:hypothetical protein